MRLLAVLSAIATIVATPGPPALAATPIELDLITTGLNLPVDITHAGDNSGRLFITQQSGEIRVHDGAALLATPFLDISDLVLLDNEQGLLSAAFHPDYASNGFFYVFYTNTDGSKNIIARYTASPPTANTVDPTTAKTILEIDHTAEPIHNGGQLQFGPNDGFLYIASGDGGPGGDPSNNAQNKDRILGKILRIDVDGGDPYAIPASNPYFGADGDDRVWARGLRNPWRFTFDRLTGDMFVGDVGEQAWEEINFQAAGAGGLNYGWRCREGAHNFNTNPACQAPLTEPIFEYANPGTGCAAAVAGPRYRGPPSPLTGTLIYGDFCAGTIFGATHDGSSWTTSLLLDTTLFISTFGEDQQGNIYVAARSVAPNGAIYRIRANRVVDTAGYVLSGWGSLHPYTLGAGSAPAVTNGPYWPGQDLARGVATSATPGSGYVLDAWGGVHAFGSAPAIAGSAYWPGWDIARGIALNPDGQGGYVLDGWGALHPFGNASSVTNGPYFPGFDLARAVVLLESSTAANPKGYVLGGYGNVYPFGSAPLISGAPSWPGWDIARGLALNSAGTGGYVLDAWGGLHRLGSASAVVNKGAYWHGWDIARSVTLLPDGSGGFILDGWGGVHGFGTGTGLQLQSPVVSGYWSGWDIARAATAL